jgi:hypothetical protein
MVAHAAMPPVPAAGQILPGTPCIEQILKMVCNSEEILRGTGDGPSRGERLAKRRFLYAIYLTAMRH